MPGDVCAIIENHHAPSYVTPSALQVSEKGLAAVHIADLLCHLVENLGQKNPGVIYQPLPEWFHALGVTGGMEATCTEFVIRALVHRVEELGAIGEENEGAA